MKKLVVVLGLVLLVGTGSAQGRTTASIAAPNRQAFAAGLAFFDKITPYTTGANTLYRSICKPMKRDRWRCPRIYVGTLPDGSPITCSMQILVSRTWWRFPPEWFGCPPEWLPTN